MSNAARRASMASAGDGGARKAVMTTLMKSPNSSSVMVRTVSVVTTERLGTAPRAGRRGFHARDQSPAVQSRRRSS